jgi:hypothetical protein
MTILSFLCRLIPGRIATVAVGAIAAVSLAPQPAQAGCSIVTITTSGATQGIAARKAGRKFQRHITQNVAGVRVGHARTYCQGWGVAGDRHFCQRSAMICG